MKIASRTLTELALCTVVFACVGCTHAPGYPTAGAEVSRPDEELDFHILYKQNCSGCHGDDGHNGAAIPLNNPAYLAVAGGDNLRTATAKGVRATLMPAFARSAGGMLTDRQIEVLVQEMLRKWGKASDFSRVELPPYTSSTPGNADNGRTAYSAACARCHGVDGTGIKLGADGKAPQGGTSPYSIVDLSYLTLVSDQSMRSLVIAGHPDKGTPDWRSYIAGPPARALTPQEISDIVAWIAAHRAPGTEQAMSNSRSNPTGVAGKETR
jgi:cytochrome c oxidase cbb3-type subunit 3/ubiquinol-cytochrome c reductase cytochrome c subunit